MNKIIGDIDYSLNLPLPELWLAQPNRNLVSKIENRSGISITRMGKNSKLIKHTSLRKVNSINELEFTLPFTIELNHQLVKNGLTDQIIESSLIKRIENLVEEWFCIIDIKRNYDPEIDSMTVTCRSLGYELVRQNIRNFNVNAQNLSSLMNGGTSIDDNGQSVDYNGLLNPTLWTLDPSYDTSFDTLFRSINISKATILDGIIQIAKTFNAVISFDTINRKINFQKLTNIGRDKGFVINYKTYLQSLENDSNIEILATRFTPTGKNNLSISGASPNGLPYIDDFTFFTNGYTRDDVGTVLTHSPHMSDSLCGALLDYKNLLNTNATTFSTLLSSLTGYQTILLTKENDMSALEATLVSIQKNLDYAQSTGGDPSTYLSQQTAQNVLIASKQTEIDGVLSSITSVESSINSLQVSMSTSTNFTDAQIKELIPFIREQTWDDNNITDAPDLYNQGLIEFEKYKTPQITLKIEMDNLFENISEQRNWDKVEIGDNVLVEYDAIGTKIKTKIIELSIDHVAGSLTLTLSSLADIIREEEALIQMIYSGYTAASDLSVNVDNWNGITQASAQVQALYKNGIDSAAIKITGGNDNNITINNRGLTSTISSDPNSLIRLNNGVLGFSADGGTTYTTAISAAGIYAPAIYGTLGSFVHIDAASITTGTLSGINMSIGSGSAIFNANASGISLGAATWAASPFRVDMSGNAWATSMTLSSPAITNGSIVGTSINIGSGVFTVSSGGALVATSATITGNITATSGSLGNLTVTGTLTGGTLIGANIKTSTSGQRIELSSSGNLLTAYGATGTIAINPSLVGDAAIQFATGSNTGSISKSSSVFLISCSDQITINSGGSNLILAGSSVIINSINIGTLNSTVNTLSSNVSTINGQISSINTSLSSKVNSGASTTSVAIADTHNHGIPNGTVLSTPTGTVTFVSYSGSAAHSHTV